MLTLKPWNPVPSCHRSRRNGQYGCTDMSSGGQGHSYGNSGGKGSPVNQTLSRVCFWPERNRSLKVNQVNSRTHHCP